MLKNRVVETTSTIGTGDYELDGPSAACLGFATFGNNEKAWYFVTDGTEFEYGVGLVRLGSPNRLERLEILGNSRGSTAPIIWQAGSKIIYNNVPAESLIYKGANGGVNGMEIIGEAAPSVVFVTNNMLVPASGVVEIDTGVEPSVTIDRIDSTRFSDGKWLYIRPRVEGRAVIIKANDGRAGQIKLVAGAKLTLTSRNDWVLLEKAGTIWQEINRSLPLPVTERAGKVLVVGDEGGWNVGDDTSIKQGWHIIGIPAMAFYPPTIATLPTIHTGAGNFRSWVLSPTASDYYLFDIPLPPSWDGKTIRPRICWVSGNAGNAVFRAGCLYQPVGGTLTPAWTQTTQATVPIVASNTGMIELPGWTNLNVDPSKPGRLFGYVQRLGTDAADTNTGNLFFRGLDLFYRVSKGDDS